MPKKVLVIMGSPRKMETYQVVQEFEKDLKSYGDVDFEYVFLKDIDLQICKGCFACLSKGEEFCPLKDDRDSLIQKMTEVDGVIFATPNYALQVTAILKTFFDRLAFIFHRPRFFNKIAMGIVTQGVYGGKDIVKYLGNVGEWWGFHSIKGFYVNTLNPRTSAEQDAITQKTAAAAKRFFKALHCTKFKSPSLFKVIIFHMVRSMYRAVPNAESKDYCYFRDQGWLTSDYYYPAPLGCFKRLIGGGMDLLGKRMAIRRNNEIQKK